MQAHGGRVAWITGASTGIGRALALRLARQGWHVAASARNAEALAALGPGIRAYPLDVTDASACARVAGAIRHDLGAIDLAVLNAGTHVPTPASSFDAQAVRALIEVNLIGAANGLAAILPDMIACRRGRIALVASVAGYRGLPGASAYCASKAGLIALAESLKFDLDPLGLKIQVINPGFVRTPLTDRNAFPMPFLMEVEDAVSRILRGLESDRFEIAFPRRFVWLLKALRLLPDRLYFALTRRATGT